MATYYIDPDDGVDANDGLSFATRKKTINFTPTANDVIRVIGNFGGSLGSATWTHESNTVTLSSAKNLTIDNCETAWTASANVTATTSTTRREGTRSAHLAFASGFTTGKAAYRTLPSTLNLSSYQGVSFLFNGTIVSGLFTLNLCSDTTGDTVVHAIPIEQDGSAATWKVVVWDNGANLSTSINSISISCNADPGTVNIGIDNIIAIKAQSSTDCLTHNSILYHPTRDEFYAIRSIDGTDIKIETRTMVIGTLVEGRGFCGTTGSVTTYHYRAMDSISSNFNASTNRFRPLYISGGWDRTSMSSQGSGGSAYSLFNWTGGISNNTNGIQFDNIGFVPFKGVAANISCGQSDTDIIFNNTRHIASCSINNARSWVFNDTKICALNGCGLSNPAPDIIKGTGLTVYSSTGNFTLQPVHIDNLTLTLDNCASGINVGATSQFSGYLIRLKELNIRNCAGTALHLASINSLGFLYVNSGEAVDNADNGINSSSWQCFFRNWVTNATPSTVRAGKVEYKDFNNVANDHRIYTGRGIITTDSSVVNNAAFSWKFTTTAYSNTASDTPNSNFPLEMLLGRIVVNSGSLVTVTAYLRRSDTNLTGRLFVKGGVISGVSNDVVSSISAAVDTWEQLTITFTPTESGVVDIYADCYHTDSTPFGENASYNMWVTDLNVTQA